MTNQTALEDIYSTLANMGVVDTKKEFYRDWLNRSEGYVRYLRHTNKQPSADALAICSSKLKHYSKLLKQKNTPNTAQLADIFANHSSQLDVLICNNSTAKWLELMNDDATVH